MQTTRSVNVAAAGFWLFVCFLPFAVRADDERLLQQQFESTIKPLLQQTCGDCHWGEEANAGLRFDAFNNIEQVLDSDRRWQSVVQELTKQTMPPVDAEPMADQERKLLLKWIDQTFKLIDCSKVTPGNVTIRRLNSIEYRNSVRDLLGVDYPAAADFPGDDVGYGFDNIADVLSLPPILLEKYLDAAESIALQAIIDPKNPSLNISLAGSAFQGENELTTADEALLAMYTTDIARKNVVFPLPGQYAIEVVAYGDQAGTEPVRMSLMLDDQMVDTVNVRAKIRRPSKHRFKVHAETSGPHDLKIGFDNDVVIESESGRQDRNLYVAEVHIRGPLPNLAAGSPTPAWLKMAVGKQTAKAADAFINEIIPRAFRRPLAESERAKFNELFAAMRKDGQSHCEAIRGVVQTVLVSPEFLYRIELPTENGARDLNAHELATALSYFLWSSTPDDELLAEAAKNNLLEMDTLDRQTARLLASPRSSALVDNFATQWLNLRLLTELQPDPKMFPWVDRKLLADMQTETRMVVADIFRRDASILELLDSEFTFLNDRLAEHYRIETNASDEFQKVSLAGAGRTGVLMHASILTLTSNPDRTSPVKRGKWILENILGDEPPPPPPGIEPLDNQTELTGTLRERMMQHRADPACASCHETMDALGFAMEHFDAVGRFRTTDGSEEIDAISELPDGTLLDGANGLRRHLRTTQRDQFVRCFTEKLLVYALGRGLRYYDRCTVERIMKQAAAADYRLSAFVNAIVQSETFRRRSPHPPQAVGLNSKDKS